MQMCIMTCRHSDALLSMPVGLQVLGLFAVMATATGCLFFLDTNTLTQRSSLNPVGVLLLLLNVGYIALMAVLISKTGARHVHGWITWFKDTGHTIAAARKWVSCSCRRSAKPDRGVQTVRAPTNSMQLTDMRLARTLSRRLSSWTLDTADFLPEGNASSTRDTH